MATHPADTSDSISMVAALRWWLDVASNITAAPSVQWAGSGEAIVQLVFERDDILDHHEYAAPHLVSGKRLHGGFDSAGNYVPPRTRTRRVAIDHWTAALRARGFDLLDADSSLLAGPRCPNVEQFRLLLSEGMGRPFYNVFTITAKLEARGLFLTQMPVPPLQDAIVEDITEMGIGHLDKGLMFAHGIDEGGEPEGHIGGHDTMWYLARDLAFGDVDWPGVEPPPSIGRDDGGRRWMPEIDSDLEAFVAFLNQLLLIEYRAEIGFASTQAVLRTAGLFPGRDAQAKEAAGIIDRIRSDEAIHVETLRLYLGELRSIRFRHPNGDTVPGSRVVDPYWKELVQWATEEQPRLVAGRQYHKVRDYILEHDSGASVAEKFDALLDDGMEPMIAT